MTPQNNNGPQAVVLTKLAGLTRTLEGPRIELVRILANFQFPVILREKQQVGLPASLSRTESLVRYKDFVWRGPG
jgi:hypothetical protein